MKDALGNSLESGHLVLWNNLIAKVTEVAPGGLSVPAKGQGNYDKTLPTVTLEVKIQLQPGQPIPLIRVVDPASEKLIESALSVS